jgi:hypothetical protein
MGTLCLLEGEGHERLEYRMLEGSCDSGEVLGYLDALAVEAEREEKPCVVVVDNAPFHTGGVAFESERRIGKRGGSCCTGCRPSVRTLISLRGCGEGSKAS